MIVYRLAKASFAALDGEGARLYGGRWNSPGRAMVYTAASPSLAVLEVLVHLDLPTALMPDDYQLLEIALPDDAVIETINRTPPTIADSVAEGDDFLIRAQALALSAPSLIVPRERNLLLNPAAPKMADVRIVSRDAFVFDPRLAGAV